MHTLLAFITLGHPVQPNPDEELLRASRGVEDQDRHDHGSEPLTATACGLGPSRNQQDVGGGSHDEEMREELSSGARNLREAVEKQPVEDGQQRGCSIFERA
jgi:hypothetical protein